MFGKKSRQPATPAAREDERSTPYEEGKVDYAALIKRYLGILKSTVLNELYLELAI